MQDRAQEERRDDAVPRHVLELGERLRRVRLQQGRSLQEVEELSGGELKASVVGAYERGERTVSIRRLEQLATFYRVPVVELLPSGRRPSPEAAAGATDLRVVLDLTALERSRDEEPAVARFVEAIRARRGDGGSTLTVRAGDLDTLAAISGSTTSELRARLVAAGILH